jgi:hypothetical protein
MWKQRILDFIKKQKKIQTKDLVKKYKISRQFAHSEIKKLLTNGELAKFGTTRYAFYSLPNEASNLEHKVEKRLINKNLKEHEVLIALENKSPALKLLPDNIRSIFDYGFSEMLNNAIEHSKSKDIDVSVSKNENLIFRINDFGIGAFRSISKKRKLKSEMEAIQDLLKGKTTTAPQAHSGEGIFFTSKVADIFILESFNYKLTIDNILSDIFIEKIDRNQKKGTKVSFQISVNSKKHLNDVFHKYYSDPEEYDFDKTEIYVRLYTMGTIHVSRSQARRVLSGLDKFRHIVLNFERVPNVGQAFADEIFRVFATKHPEIKIEPFNMNETVEFMVKRSINIKR